MNTEIQPDLDSLCARIAYRGVGRFLCDFLKPLGVTETEVLQRHDGEPYDIELPHLGLGCTIQYMGNTGAAAEPSLWALNTVRLTSQYAPSGPPGWQGAWWGGIDPHHCTLDQAKQALSMDCVTAGSKASFFYDAEDGRALVVGLSWAPGQTRLLGASMGFLGGYRAWPRSDGESEQED